LGSAVFRSDHVLHQKPLVTLRNTQLSCRKAELSKNGRRRCRRCTGRRPRRANDVRQIGVLRALNRHVSACSVPTEKTSIGDATSWRGIRDNDRKLLRRQRILTACALTEADHFGNKLEMVIRTERSAARCDHARLKGWPLFQHAI
jgi:hypothetical protein